MKLEKRLLRLLIGRRRVEALRLAKIMRSPDRATLINAYLPAFAAEGGRILWVGCREYTAAYPAMLEAYGAEVWTTDIDEVAETWGRAGRHRTGNIRQADQLFADLKFDAVLCNGVLGCGVNSPEDQAQALEALAMVLKPGGRLLLGWNHDRIADPVASGLISADFVASAFANLPQRVTYDRVTHVFDHFRRSPLSA